MYTAEYDGINSFLVGAARMLLEFGIERNTRGYKCWELPEPIMIKIRNPLSRWITLPCRKWNILLPYAESLWLAGGRNDLYFIKHYLSKMEEYSDNGKYLRGGYGPRLRAYNGNPNDYEMPKLHTNKDNGFKELDQFRYVINSFEQDPYTRQAIITMGDPPKDCFNSTNDELKKTKDRPCTRSLQFIRNPQNNKLNMTVYMRSNDLIWGASAVNIFNYTFMQEYFSQMLGLEVGEYFHIANNLHYYDYHKSLIEELASLQNVKDDSFCYEKNFNSLEDFDRQIKKLIEWEDKLRTNNKKEIIGFEDDFFNDWAKVLFFKTGLQQIEFTNPILNHLLLK